MSQFRLGPFEVVEKIGSGGMGDVWSGVHVAQDIPVAIKVLRLNAARDERFKAAFRREVRAVARLDHPGIITLLDIGEVTEETASGSDGALDIHSPYLVMEYLERGSLESLEYPVSWSKASEILSAVLDGLAHAHARGIIHRDIKPGNILIAEPFAGSPVRLTDFGIAFSHSEHHATKANSTMMGTPMYMAPEQFLGEWRDFGPWSDLYALGCVAYELASGRVPFEQQELVQLGLAHVGSSPPEFDCPPGYPDGFRTWVMRLLEKDPKHRYRRCADAAAALASLTPPTPGREERSGAVSLDWRAPSPTRRPFKLVGAGLRLFGLRTVPIVGRDAERDLLWGMFRRVSERGTPALVVLEGSAGVGKSRLAEWLCERTNEMGLASSLRAEHDRSHGGDYGLSRGLAQAWSCLGTNAEELQSRVSAMLSSTGIDSRSAHEVVAEFLAPASLGSDFSPGMFYEFPSHSACFSVLFEVLRRLYNQVPLVIWLDDVQWGAGALQFLRYVLERSRTEPIPLMAVVTVRDDLLVESREVSGLLRELCLEEAAECMRLEPLSNPDSRRLVSNLLYLEGDLAEQVSVRSGGNPLYATQLVDDWVNRGTLIAGDSGFVLHKNAQPEIPDDVHAVWVQRLERVLDECTDGGAGSTEQAAQRIQAQVLFELAAALGGRVDMAEWVLLSSLAGVPDPSPVLEPLLASRMARVSADSWSFSHSMLSDSIERIAREKHRWESHNRMCADMLEQRRPVPHWGDSERIGRHRFEAAQFEAGLRPLLRGAREQMRLEEFSVALGLLVLLDRALDELARPNDDPQRLEGWLLRAEINCTRRDLKEAEELANRVRVLAGRADTKRFDGAALLVLARIHKLQGKLRTALHEFEAAQRTLRITGPKHTLAACLSEHAHAMLDLDMLDQAWEAFHESQEIYEEVGQMLPWAETQLALARIALRQGDSQHAMTLCRRVRTFARRHELKRIEADAYSVLAEVQRQGGQLTDAERSLDRSIELFDELRLERQAIHARLLKILLLLESRSVDQAKPELALLRRSPRLDLPPQSRLLMSSVGLVFAVDAPADDFQSSFDQTAALLGEVEVLPSDVLRCLRLAIERAHEIQFPDRAAQIKRFDATVPT